MRLIDNMHWPYENKTLGEISTGEVFIHASYLYMKCYNGWKVFYIQLETGERIKYLDKLNSDTTVALIDGIYARR